MCPCVKSYFRSAYGSDKLKAKCGRNSPAVIYLKAAPAEGDNKEAAALAAPNLGEHICTFSISRDPDVSNRYFINVIGPHGAPAAACNP